MVKFSSDQYQRNGVTITNDWGCLGSNGQVGKGVTETGKKDNLVLRPGLRLENSIMLYSDLMGG
jgi:hypothetical protein